VEVCGWKNLSFDVWHNGLVGVLPTNKDVRSKIPDYCNDLNAIAEAEKHLTEDQLETMNTRIWEATMNQKCIWQATARQRAMALIEAVYPS
jgi:hypothetical protein